MNFNKLNKVMAVATVLATVSCLAPESALALGQPSGNSSNSSKFTFDLIPVSNQVPDKAHPDILGFFPKAIQNFSITGSLQAEFFNQNDICLSFEKGTCKIEEGDLTITKLTTSNGKAEGNVLTANSLYELTPLLVYVSEGPPEPITLIQLQDIFNTETSVDTRINLFKKNNETISINNILMYNVSFVGTNPVPELIWFVETGVFPQKNNDLSEFIQFNKAVGIFPNDIDPSQPTQGGGQFALTLVPEPTTAIGLLSLGALGAVSLLKRNKGKKLVEHKKG